MTRDEIRLVVRAKLPQIRACFEAGLTSAPDLRGRVLLRFVIDPDGKAREIEVVDDQLGHASVTTCIVEQLPRWQFPRPRDGQSIAISYPFAFSSEQSLRAQGLPRVEGTVKPEAVGAVFEARRSELDMCLPAGASGSIGVAFTIDDRGAVTRISSYRDSLPDDAGSCVLRTLSSWVFPPAAGGDEARVNHDLQW
ncbi:MAG TPA: AgmX/PglI C-terminal domain-containing protein [Enhygromyxa sp.]|nr:AgmX/PglI C-terminal domain-containing protein [Enhygromyxa sp.]